MTGGEGGIRTLGTLSRTHAFQACALNHSATSPLRLQEGARKLGIAMTAGQASV